MIRTKKILALFLAVVLMFSALPFSVSADEIEMVEMDAPVLFAQDPFTQVKNEVEGGTSYMTSVGVTRESIVRELEAHEHDSYYLGTKYVGGDAQSPNGDTSYNDGTVGMNCGGFVSYVLRKAGLDADLVMEIMQEIPGTTNWFGSGKPYDILAGASNYLNLIKNYNISAYAFRTKQELLSSGLAEKGDIILMWWSDNPGADGADNHIGFFWGEASDDDILWHSGTEPSSGNQISAITPKTPGSFYILIKIEPLQPKEYEVTLTKTSADVSITQGNSAYSLAGATYNVYKGTSGTGSVVATFTTDEAGHATLSTPLEDGTYSVKEVTPPKGYKLDTKVYTFTIDGSDTSLSVEDEPGTLTLKLKKKDSQTGSTPQGNASLAGAVYQIIIAPKGGLLIQKTSEDGVLEGFTFLVESENYSEIFTTDGAGKIYIQDMAPGEYTVTEQESDLTVRYEIPAGQTITVTADEATTVEFYNQLLRGKITGHKTGAEQAPLEGVTFGLFDAETTEFTEETALATSITDESGEFTFEAPYGDYQVAELETVPGYVTMKETIAVEVNKTDVDLEDIANSQTVVHFSKVDKETGEELPGAVLELYSPDGSLLDTWETTDIPHVIPGLPVGEGYVLREVSAPDGYEVSEDITFEVTDTTEIQTITMEDEPTPEEPDEPEKPEEPEEPEEATPEIPQTGESPAVFWIGGLLILALLGLCVTIPLLRHCNKQ